ncbi:MAG: hypothetical protein ACI4XI_05630 [Ruminococcus sp.]
MKNSTASNRKTIRMITKNLIILLVLVFVTILAMWAWFTSHTEDVADGLNVQCDVPDGIEIAIVAPGATPTDDDYTTSYITLNAENYAFIEDLVMSEVTSDGKTFYKPALIQSNGVAYADTSADWEKATANENYLSFDLYIRSKTSHTVSLTTSSKFTTLYPDQMVGENSYNKSTEGDYSRDCIVGAARFSVVDYTDSTEGELKLLWIPRPDIYFYSGSGSSGVELDVAETDYDGLTYKHNYYEVTDTSKTLKTIDSDSGLDYFETSVKNSENEYVLEEKTVITENLGGRTGDDLYYTKCLRCNMWVDGEDTEDRLALVKGKFQIYLDLTIK